MSNWYTSKPLTKPLKGGSVSANYGEFDTINANNIKLESLEIDGILQDGVLTNVIIEDSQIRNTVIGLEGPTAAVFTTLQTLSDVTLLSNIPGASVNWGANSGLLYITSDLKVDGCSELGNIEICNNDIKSTNLNGDINVSPNGVGTVYLNAPVIMRSSNGSFSANYTNGGMTFVIRDNMTVYSSQGNLNLTSFGPQTFSARNGDLTLAVDTARTVGSITSVLFTAGNIVVNTPLAHQLTTGNVVTITNPLLNGTFTVGNITSNTQFRLTSSTSGTSQATGGTFLKSASNNIILNSANLVAIPSDTRLIFGDTQNAISGNSNGTFISSAGDIVLNMSAGNKVTIPQHTSLQFGTSANNAVLFDGSTLNISAGTGVITGSLLQINTTHVRVQDPILTLADYTLNTTDGKDRGIEFRYYDTSAGSMQVGWFGYKSASNAFTFFTNATNTNEVITGNAANAQFGNLQVNTLSINAGNFVDLNCGSLVNANVISGCSGLLTLSGSSNVVVSASSRISLSAGTDVLIPTTTLLRFGTGGSFLQEQTSGTLHIVSRTHTQFLTSSNGAVSIPVATRLVFDGTTNGGVAITGTTSGDLLVNASGNIALTTTGGNVLIPNDTAIHFGNSTQRVSGNTGGLFVTGSAVTVSSSVNDIVLFSSLGNVRIPEQRRLVFGMSGTQNSISTSSSGDLLITGSSGNSVRMDNVSNIDLFASSTVTIPLNTRIRFGTDASRSVSADTSNGIALVNTTTNGTVLISSAHTILSNTQGTLSAINVGTTFSSGNFTVTGTTGSVARIDSENIRIRDPIVTIADYTLATSDSKDRGIEYRYYDTSSGSMKLGWFGRKSTTGRFTLIGDGTNTSEVMSGTAGDMEVGGLFLNGSIAFQSSGSINMNCGSLTNVNSITGCSGVVSINGTTSITHTARDIFLSAGTAGSVTLPFNVPLSFGNTATSFISGSSNGILTIQTGTVVFNSNVQINGTTYNVFSTVTNIQDPIISLGGVTGPVVDDNKDRGIEFKWNDSGISKVGFFGFKDALQRFVFIPDGVNVNEVFSGSYGSVQFGDGFFNNLSLQNGTISGVNTLSGGIVNIVATSGNVNITPTSGSNVLLPFSTPIAFGNTTNSIQTTSAGTMLLTSSMNTTIQASTGTITLNANTGVGIPNNVPLYFGSLTTGTSLSAVTSGTATNLLLTNSQGNIDLTPASSFGSIQIPANNPINFSSTTNQIYSDGTALFINGYNGVNFASSNVTFSGNVTVTGTINASNTTFDFNDYIFTLGTFQVLAITSIVNSVTTGGNVSITTSVAHNFVVGDAVELRNTTSDPVIDGFYTVTSIVSPTVFKIERIGTVFTTNGFSGTVKSKLATQQAKDVGIQVNYWSTTGNPSLTAGTLGFKTGFFGFDQSSERWTFLSNATIANSVATGTIGDIEVNKVFTSRMSGFVLDGAVSGGTNSISGTNFTIGGGTINNTPIGVTTAQSGRFTTLSNTVSASLTAVTLQSSLAYSISDLYTLSLLGVQFRSPSINTVLSLFSVTGVNYTGSSGTMPSTAVPDGTYKVLVCRGMDTGCSHTVFFGAGKLIAPNPLNPASQPTRLTFKRRGQSAQMVWDGSAWILIGGNAYVTE